MCEIAKYIIGRTERFAIEFRLLRKAPGPFGCISLWIQDNIVENPDDPIFIYPILLMLEGILARHTELELSETIFNMDLREAWELLLSQGDDYKMPPIDFFDNIDMYAIPWRGSIRFLWIYLFDSEKQIKTSVVQRKDVMLVLNEFRQIFDSIRQACIKGDQA